MDTNQYKFWRRQAEWRYEESRKRPWIKLKYKTHKPVRPMKVWRPPNLSCNIAPQVLYVQSPPSNVTRPPLAAYGPRWIRNLSDRAFCGLDFPCHCLCHYM